MISTLLIAATIATGLVTGLLYGFSCAVLPGLRQVDDATFVEVFRAINGRIINGWFLLTFLGSPVLIVTTGIAQFLTGGPQPWLPMAAAAVSTVISSAITGAVNVPLNNALESDANAVARTGTVRAVDSTAIRTRFETRWSRANVARTVASTAAFGALTWAIAIS